MKFSELNLHKQAVEGTSVAGFSECMPVQAAVLPVSLTGVDVMVQSKTGSGKTAAFILTFLEKYLRNIEQGIKSSCLIIAPTRELAQQIASDAKILCSKAENFTVGCFFGGVGYAPQEKLLKQGCDIYVGTPGRLLDFIHSKQLDCSTIDTFIMDEADRMFDMGFLPDIRKIFSYLPAKEKRQTMLFSATLEMRVRELAWEYMNDPKEIELEPEHITVENIIQELFHVAKSDKFKLLLQILEKEKPASALIFTNSRFMTEEVSKRLKQNGYNSDFLSGNLSQAARDKALGKIKSGKTSILVATDVAARGLQIDNLPLVVNYDVPEDYENYVHRIGRTARAGKSGKAIMLADEEFVYGLEAIEKYIKMKIPVIWPDGYPDVEDKSLRKPEHKVEHKTERDNSRKSLGQMSESERLAYYKKKYGFVPENSAAVKEQKQAGHAPVIRTALVMIPIVVRILLFFVLCLIPSCILRIFGKKTADKYLFFGASNTANFILKLYGVRVHVSGNKENINIEGKPVCYISNHTSLLDVPLILGACKIRTGFITKSELAYVPVFNLIILVMHGVFINRKNLKDSVASIKRGAEKIRKGNAILIFPEGSRSKEDRVGIFKKGAFRLATESGATMVPITIRGVRKALESRCKVFGKVDAYINIGETVDSSSLKSREEKIGISAVMEKEICRTYAGLGKPSGKRSYKYRRYKNERH